MSLKSDGKRENRERAEQAFQLESQVRGLALFEAIRSISGILHIELGKEHPDARSIPRDSFCMAVAAIVVGQDPEAGPDLVRGLVSVSAALTEDHRHATIPAFYEMATAARVLAKRITPQGADLRAMFDHGHLFEDLSVYINDEVLRVVQEVTGPQESGTDEKEIISE